MGELNEDAIDRMTPEQRLQRSARLRAAQATFDPSVEDVVWVVVFRDAEGTALSFMVVKSDDDPEHAILKAHLHGVPDATRSFAVTRIRPEIAQEFML